jgi:hypothetical protein
MRVEAFFSEAAVERFDEAVVGRLARSTEVQNNAVLIGPAVECVGDELRAVVADDLLR